MKFTATASARPVFFRAAAMAAAASAALLATDALADHPAGTGGKFTVHINRDIGGFDHLRVPQGGMGRYQVLFAAHDTLFNLNKKTGELIPRLGTELTSSDGFKNWRVTLRKGVRFSNGEELTSEAYVHHFKRLNANRLAPRFHRQLGGKLVDIVAIDKYTFEFRFAKSNQAFKAVIASGGVYLWYLNAPGFAKANENKADYNRMSVGAGPYMVKEWVPGKGVTMVRNPNYWNPAEQHADEIFYRITTGPEQGPQWNALRAGDIDVGWSLAGGIIPLAEKNEKLTFLNGERGQLHWGINFNQDYKPFDDVRVRRALAHAIDRKAIIRVVTKGSATLANQAFPPGSQWYCQGIEYPEYNPEKARALLKEYGKKLPKVKVLTYNIPPFRKTVEMIQDMWRKVGFDVEIETGGRGPTGVVGKLVKGEAPIFMITSGSTIHPTVFDSDLHSKSKDNLRRSKSPKIDSAIEKLQAAQGFKAVKKAHCEFERVKAEEVPYMPFEYAVAAVIAQKDIGGLVTPDDPRLGYHKIFRKKK